MFLILKRFGSKNKICGKIIVFDFLIVKKERLIINIQI